MMKIQVNEAQVGMTIKVKVHTNSDKSTCLVAAHTKSAIDAKITEIDGEGRWIFLVTDAGSIMMGRGGKVTVV